MDGALLLFLNGAAGVHPALDRLLVEASRSSLLKFGPPVALLWWAWTRGGAGVGALPALRAVAGAALATAAARLMQNLLGPRLRPLHDPEVAAAGLVLAQGLDPGTLRGWGAFPSDHAVLAFALSTAVWLAHRGAGAAAFAWVGLVVCLPRVVLGLHFPSDIVAGAAIGAAIALAAGRVRLPRGFAARVEGAARAHPGVLHGVLFLATFQIATLFADTRGLAEAARALVALLL